MAPKKKSSKKPIKLKKKQPPVKRGRPTKYKSEYCQAIIDYFDISPVDKNGKANDIVFLSAFARKIGVTHDTLIEWTSKYPEFSESYKDAKRLQREMMIINAIQGRYNASFAWRAMMNMHGWRDKTDTVSTELTLEELISMRDGENKEK